MTQNPSLQNLKCPDCQGPMVSRKSQYGVFWGCRSYPKCKGSRDSMGLSREERRNLNGDCEREEERKPSRRYE